MKLFLQALVVATFLLPVGAQAHKKGGNVTTINPPGIFDPSAYGFSHVAIGQGTRVVYISGQSGEDDSGVYSSDFRLQAKRTYRHLARALKAAKAKRNQVTKITTYIVDYDYEKLGIATEVLKNFFGDHKPAQTLVPVPRLALDGMLIEVDAIAVTR